MTTLLEARSISKRYGGTEALRGVDFSVQAGEVHALMGENGAGKSTLAKILAGVVVPDQGEIFARGKMVRIRDPRDAQSLGVGIVFQELDLFPHLTIAENIAIANSAAREGFLVDFQRLDAWCIGFLRQVKLSVTPGTLVRDLSVSEVQRVAIARALSLGAQLLVFDEPTSSLADPDVLALLRLINHLKAEGVAFVYVTHKMEEVHEIADRITVLRDGRFVATKRAAEATTDEVVAMMVGRALQDNAHPHRTIGEAVLQARAVETAYLRGITFTLHQGEVLGIAGLLGAGRSELGAVLFGLRKRIAGDVILNGEPFCPTSPIDAIRNGVCLLPEDRRSEGIFPQLSVRENASISALLRMDPRRRFRLEAERVAEFQESLRIRCSDTIPIASLSGGNQQKILLARVLMTEPSVLFLDEPTRGIDVGVKQEIYRMIDELATQQKAVILVSSELPELWRCCNRILVLHEGEQVGIVNPACTTQEQVMALAAGLHSPNPEPGSLAESAQAPNETSE